MTIRLIQILVPDSSVCNALHYRFRGPRFESRSGSSIFLASRYREIVKIKIVIFLFVGPNWRPWKTGNEGRFGRPGKCGFNSAGCRFNQKVLVQQGLGSTGSCRFKWWVWVQLVGERTYIGTVVRSNACILIYLNKIFIDLLMGFGLTKGCRIK